MRHLPRSRLVAIGTRGQRSDWANIDAHAAFFALEVILLVRKNGGNHSAVLDAERPNIHAFATHADTAIAENAAGPVKVHHWRPLLLITMVLQVDEFGLGSAVGKRHVLQFALAAGVANRAIEWVISEQQLHHALAGLANLVAVGRHHHALRDASGTGGLQLGHFLNAYQAHAACALQRQIRVIAERGYFDADSLAGFNQKRARRRRELLAIDGEVYEFCRFSHSPSTNALNQEPAFAPTRVLEESMAGPMNYAITGNCSTAPACSKGQGFPSR